MSSSEYHVSRFVNLRYYSVTLVHDDIAHDYLVAILSRPLVVIFWILLNLNASGLMELFMAKALPAVPSCYHVSFDTKSHYPSPVQFQAESGINCQFSLC